MEWMLGFWGSTNPIDEIVYVNIFCGCTRVDKSNVHMIGDRGNI